MFEKSVIKSVIIICLAAIVVGLLFTLVLYLFRPTAELWAWFIQFAATLISATLAIAAGVGLFAYQRFKSDEARSDQLLTALAGELQSCVAILNTEQRDRVMALNGQEFGTAVLVRMPPLVAEEAVRSGVFDATDTLLLSNLVREMWAHNGEVSFLLSVRSAPITAEALRIVVERFNRREERMREQCNALLEQLKSLGIKAPTVPT